MRLTNHGGLCCGVKHIYGLDESPASKTYADHKPEYADMLNHDQMGRAVKSDLNLFGESFGRNDKCGDVFDRMVAYCRKWRPKGVIETTIVVESKYGRADQSAWIPFFEERNFKEVTRFKNSNSGNTVAIFHLVYSDEVTT